MTSRDEHLVAKATVERSGRQWKVVCESARIGGLYAAVMSGLAVSVVARSTVTTDAVRYLEGYIRLKLRV